MFFCTTFLIEVKCKDKWLIAFPPNGGFHISKDQQANIEDKIKHRVQNLGGKKVLSNETIPFFLWCIRGFIEEKNKNKNKILNKSVQKTGEPCPSTHWA